MKLHLSAILLAMSSLSCWAGPLLVDEPRIVAGLVCLPNSANQKQFYYLPGKARIAADNHGNPKFSLVYTEGYFEDGKRSGDGALLHMLVEYYTPKQQIARAQRALRKLVDPKAVLVGPVNMDEGTYSVRSATVGGAPVSYGEGKAPTLPGSEIAVSLLLNRQQATRLKSALSVATPDLSVVFDLVYSGVTSSYDAEIVIDWDKASESLDRGIAAGVSVYGIGLGGEIEESVNDLISSGAIRIDVRGEDANMDAIVTQVQQAATGLFFEPIEDPNEFSGSSDLASASVNPPRSTNRYFSINAKAKYKRKRLVTKGKSQISLSKSNAAQRRWSVVFNAGDLGEGVLSSAEYVRVESLQDNGFQPREITISPESGLAETFTGRLSQVTVELRKTHANGKETLRQTALPFTEGSEVARISYPRLEDEPWETWAEYQYRTIWDINGESRVYSKWESARTPSLVVSAPIKVRQITPIGDLKALKERGVAAVGIELKYRYFGEERSHQKLLFPKSSNLDPIEVAADSDESLFQYTVTHIYPDDRRKSYSGSDRLDFVPIDRDLTSFIESEPTAQE